MLNERLTRREWEVLVLLVDYSQNKEIATNLVIAESTVKRHVRNILSKLSVTNRRDAVREALRKGLLAPRPTYVINDALAAKSSQPRISSIEVSHKVQRPPQARAWWSLTKRQREIAVKLMDISGARMSSRALAGELGITEPTMKKHLQRIYRRVGVPNRSSLIVIAQHMIAFENSLEDAGR